jgi:UDP-N-acetylmuramate-alanine ligase
MERVTARLGLTPDYGQRPFQSFRQQFAFRDSAAHGRTEVISGHQRHRWSRSETSEEEIPHPISRLDQLMPSDVRRSLEDVKAIIRELHRLAHEQKPDTFWESGDPLFLVSGTSY